MKIIVFHSTLLPLLSFVFVGMVLLYLIFFGLIGFKIGHETLLNEVSLE